eukprot:m.19335 g.19335  ORF g.19335 m.19335 type:complete len:83 (-) comp11790_c0_seq1:48-296(-)
MFCQFSRIPHENTETSIMVGRVFLMFVFEENRLVIATSAIGASYASNVEMDFAIQVDRVFLRYTLQICGALYEILNVVKSPE